MRVMVPRYLTPLKIIWAHVGRPESSIKEGGMSSRHQDVEYIPLDSGPTEPTAARRTFASAKYAGQLFLAAIFFTAIFVGVGVGRWFKVPNVITTLIPSSIVVDPVDYGSVVTLYDSFVDMCVSACFL